MNAISWTYVILAEFVNARSGLGYLIQLAGTHLKTDEIFSGIMVIGVIGLLTDAMHPRASTTLFSAGGRRTVMSDEKPADDCRSSTQRPARHLPLAQAATTSRRCAASTSRSPTSRASARSSSSSARRAAASRPSSRRWRACCRPPSGEVLVDGEPVDGRRPRSRHGVPDLHLVRLADGAGRTSSTASSCRASPKAKRAALARSVHRGGRPEGRGERSIRRRSRAA